MAGAQVAWGIDIGASSLKAIKLRRDGERVTVEAFEVIEHDKFLTEPDVDRDMMIRSTLQKFITKYNVRRDTVFIGVPGSSTFARFVKLPPVETKKIPEIVRFEAIQQIPFPLDQVNWDYHTFQQADSPDVEVGIFAMKKELVAQVMSNFQAADMPVAGVQMSPLAVYNAAAYDGMTDGKGTVVLDMGAEHTDLVVIDQGRLWLRTINIGGNHFTDALAKSFKQSFTKAESLKKTAATSKYQKQIYQSMRPIFADLVAEIQRSIGFYNSSHRDSRLERIVAMGNPLKLPNLQKYLQQELKMDVVRLEQFNNANVEKAAAFSEDILSMTAAYGLAVQALGMAPINSNLLPVEIARKMMWKKKQPWFVGAAALVALGAVGIAGQWWMARSAFASQVPQQEANEAAMAEIKHEVDAWRAIPDTYQNDKTKVDAALKLAANRALWPQLLSDIYGSLPQATGRAGADGSLGVYITSVTQQYHGILSAYSTANATPTAIVNTPVPTDTPSGEESETPMEGAPPPPPPPSGPTATAVGVVGPSDHGFIVILSGYTPKPPGNALLHTTAQRYQAELMKRAPLANKDRPYYFSSDNRRGGPLGGPAVTRGTVTPAAMAAIRGPWGGGQNGPYLPLFFQELTGFRQTAPAGAPAGMMPGMDVDLMNGNSGMGFGGATPTAMPYPPDLASPRGPNGLPRNMVGYYQFTLMFKVHVKD